MKKGKLETIILRFRDLNTSDTIISHKSIIEQFGYVWWGWWAKPQEKVPMDEFNELYSLSVRTHGLPILLFDSGRETIYKAVCKQIKFYNGQKIETPEPDKTPKYYRTSCYRLWFKLSEISECLPDNEVAAVLHQYSYLRVDNFFVSGKSPFSVFYNKLVYSLSELIEQQRTIWFLKKYEIGDKKNEIHSYNNDFLMNQENTANFPVLKSNEIIWLSDLHFSENYHSFVERAGDKNKLSIRLHKEIEKIGDVQPSFGIISGDLTYKAGKEEFDCVRLFLKDLNSIFGLNQSLYAIVPGNHDIAFSEIFDEKKPVTVAFEQAKEAYVDFYRKYFGVEPQEKLYSIHRFLTKNLQPIEIICINSCLLQQEKGHFQGMGFVGNDQMNEVEEYIKATKETKIFRILVMHHHLLPVLFKEEPKADRMYSMMLDSEALNNFIIRNHIRLVLHGHSHKDFYTEVIRKADHQKYKYYVVGIGSTGAIQSKLSEYCPNMFALLKVEFDKIVVKGYSIYADGQDSRELFSHDIPFDEQLQ